MRGLTYDHPDDHKPQDKVSQRLAQPQAPGTENPPHWPNQRDQEGKFSVRPGLARERGNALIEMGDRFFTHMDVEKTEEQQIQRHEFIGISRISCRGLAPTEQPAHHRAYDYPHRNETGL